ncbi:hypothetical protein AB0L40_11440 [Patulibacter sp. NPDC049589]|uniref:hypothetical protein n=1 Tax=Patulibacter sp. NPDC049589 TaxID=3154731 RepID=UPI003438843D
MSLAFAAGDRRVYDGARTAAADLVLDRDGDAVKADHLRIAGRLIDRVEHRDGDPRSHRRESLADRIAAERKAASKAERCRPRPRQREGPAEAGLPYRSLPADSNR